MASQTTITSQQDTTSGPSQLQPQEIELEPFGYNSEQNARNVVLAEMPPPRGYKLIVKILSAGFSFFVAGTIDGSLGPLIPYILRTYNIGTGSISIMYVRCSIPLTMKSPSILLKYVSLLQ